MKKVLYVFVSLLGLILVLFFLLPDDEEVEVQKVADLAEEPQVEKSIPRTRRCHAQL
jgi:hypothetical protein